MYFKIFIVGRIFLTSLLLFGMCRRFFVVLLVIYLNRICDYNFYYKKHHGLWNRYFKCPEMLQLLEEEYFQHTQSNIYLYLCKYLFSPFYRACKRSWGSPKSSFPPLIYLFIKYHYFPPYRRAFWRTYVFIFVFYI